MERDFVANLSELERKEHAVTQALDETTRLRAEIDRMTANADSSARMLAETSAHRDGLLLAQQSSFGNSGSALDSSSDSDSDAGGRLVRKGPVHLTGSDTRLAGAVAIWADSAGVDLIQEAASDDRAARALTDERGKWEAAESSAASEHAVEHAVALANAKTRQWVNELRLAREEERRAMGEQLAESERISEDLRAQLAAIVPGGVQLNALGSRRPGAVATGGDGTEVAVVAVVGGGALGERLPPQRKPIPPERTPRRRPMINI